MTMPDSTSLTTPRAVSVLDTGEVDSWKPNRGYEVQRGPDGVVRLLVSVPADQLATTHQSLVRVLGTPLGVLYRRCVNRAQPRPEGAPPDDFVGLECDSESVLSALKSYSNLCYHDARSEIWIRGSLGDQVILDQDGILYCYPDDPAFRDALASSGIEETSVETLLDRDYVKHWYHSDNDALETALIECLELTLVAGQRR